MNEPIDISAFLPADTSELHILNTAGQQTGWIVTLAGPSHPKSVAYSDAVARRALDRAKRQEQAQVNGKKYKAEDQTPDDVRRENVEGVVARIVEWTPVKIGADTYDASRAAELLIKPEMGWAYAQILDAFGDERRFTKASAKI
ncbi:Putative branched-chain amino acid ABC transporter [Neorhizobium galegae bv. officinalis bv. officinalis str. HAMBI 1141]|uniref:Putative branched-chain amino acid ABC transporter n=2 Tax=Neorhizobium galegae TaxID=399 RepID=A0A068T2B6_NEOGA|nr:Putative branched-chain amino acid ABC transporter [Neorhizobium galegae bv. officinalis bv. officinalis str. HAMBI 1141]